MSRYIDADKLNKFDYEMFDGPLTEDAVQGIETVLNYIDNIPTANVKPIVRGEWVKNKQGYTVCSICGARTSGAVKRRYCGSCGADLGGDKE